MPADLDPRDYIQAPPLDVPSAITLGTSLLSALPKGAPDNVKGAAKHLRKAVKDLEGAYKATPAAPAVDARPIDRRVDVAWGALFRRLDSLAELPAATCPRAARAAALRDRIYPPKEGLSFLSLGFDAEWAAVKAHLSRIDEEGLTSDIDELAGDEYLPEIRASFEAYGKALNVTTKAEEREVVESRLSLLQAVGAAIRDHAIAILGMRVPGDAKSQAIVRAALAPIDDHRARLRARAAGAPATPPPAEGGGKDGAPPDESAGGEADGAAAPSAEVGEGTPEGSRPAGGGRGGNPRGVSPRRRR
jgi:hypothetical protein